MICDLNGSLGSRQFLNVVNERTCFTSRACAFKSSRLFTRFECTARGGGSHGWISQVMAYFENNAKD